MNIFSRPKNKTKQKNIPQEKLSIREKSEIIFQICYGCENGAGPGGRCSVTGVALEFGFLGGYSVNLELSPSTRSFPQASQCTLFVLSVSSFPFSLCLCLPWPRDQDLSFSLESKTFQSQHMALASELRWSVDHRRSGSKATAYIFQPLFGRLMLLLHLNECHLQKGASNGLLKQPQSPGTLSLSSVACNGPAQPTIPSTNQRRRVPRRPLCQQFTLLWSMWGSSISEDAHLFWTTGPICILFCSLHDSLKNASTSSLQNFSAMTTALDLVLALLTACCLVGETEVPTHTVIHHQVLGGPCPTFAEPLTMPPGIWGGFCRWSHLSWIYKLS